MSSAEEFSFVNARLDESGETDWKELALALMVANTRALDMADEFRRVAKLVDRIVEAYEMKGLFPGYRAYAVSGLQKEWPELWKALEDAVVYCQQTTAG